MLRSLAFLLLVGCSGARPEPPAAPADIDGWLGARVATDRAAPERGIELGDGRRFQSLTAFTTYQTGDEPRCALYVVRVDGARLAEGHRSVPCGGRDLSQVQVPVGPIEEPRAGQLRTALAGADPRVVPDAPVGSAAEHTVVVLMTDRGAVEHGVPAAAWPLPDPSQPEPAYGRAPRDLGEVWEAVLYPHRYAR